MESRPQKRDCSLRFSPPQMGLHSSHDPEERNQIQWHCRRLQKRWIPETARCTSTPLSNTRHGYSEPSQSNRSSEIPITQNMERQDRNQVRQSHAELRRWRTDRNVHNPGSDGSPSRLSSHRQTILRHHRRRKPSLLSQCKERIPCTAGFHVYGRLQRSG